MSNERYIAIIKATLAVLFWGASFIATKVALEDVSPVTVVWIRFGVGVLILGIVVIFRQQLTIPNLKTTGYFALLGFLGITFHQWLQSNGLLTSQAGTTAWIVATTPIFMAAIGWVILREKLNRVQTLGIALATFGVILVVSKGDLGLIISGGFGAPGDILILISALNWAVFSVLSRRVLDKYPAAMVMFYIMLAGWLFTSVLLISQSGFAEISQLTNAGWLAVIFLGITCSGIAYIFWFDALKVIPAAQLGSFLYVEPIVAVVVALIVLGESIHIASVLGGMAILLGVWMVNRRAKKNNG